MASVKTNLFGFDGRVPQGKEEWLTPPFIIQDLGPFDLDPCAPVVRPWPTASRYYTTEDDGLIQPWSGRVWLNPPYGDQTGRWLKKLAEHGSGIALTFARTETKIFFDYIWSEAKSILFLKGRLQFHNVDGSKGKHCGGAPSCLIAYGKLNAEILKKSKIQGRYIELKS